MGRTRRYSHEDDYEVVEHRVPPTEVARINRIATRPFMRRLPKIMIIQRPVEQEIIAAPEIVPGWVPSRIAGRTAIEQYMREERLTLIEEIGSQDLELASGSY